MNSMGSISTLMLIVISIFIVTCGIVSGEGEIDPDTIIQYKLPKDKFPQSAYIDFDKILNVEKSIAQKIDRKPNIEDEKANLVRFFKLLVEDGNQNEKQFHKKYKEAYEEYVANTKRLNHLIQKLYDYNLESEVIKDLKARLNSENDELFADSKAADKVQPIIQNVHKNTLEDIKEIEEEIKNLRIERPKIREQYSQSIVQYKEHMKKTHKYLKHASNVVDSFVEQYKQYISVYDDQESSTKELSDRDSEVAKCSAKSNECHRELRVFAKDLLTGKATLTKSEKQLSVDCPKSYTEKQKDDDCPMGQKLVSSFKKYKWKYCPYHTCKPIKCPQNWLDLEGAECPVGKRRKPVKRAYYNGRKKCDYFVCKERKNVQAVDSRRHCTSWGDPHYVTFSGRKYDYYGTGDYLLALSKGHNLRVDTRLKRCNGRRSCNEKAAVRLNEKRTYRISVDRDRSCRIIERETGKPLKDGERINLADGGYIYLYHRRRFKAVSKDGAYVWGKCIRPGYMNVYVNSNGVPFTHGMCVRKSDHKINVKGLLSDIPKRANHIQGHNSPWKSHERKKKAYRLCSQLEDDFIERDCIFDIKEMSGSPEEIFEDYKQFIEDFKQGEPHPKTCKEVLDQKLGKGSGIYSIYPGGESSERIQVYCDMETEGGGWTHIATIADDNNDYWTWKNQHVLYKGNEYGSIDHALSRDYQSKAWTAVQGNQILFKSEREAKKYLIYNDIVSGDSIASKYTPDNKNIGEFSPSVVKGNWWYQCNSLNMSLKHGDTDHRGHTWSQVSVGFVWRSNNNDGCNYDDAFGGINWGHKKSSREQEHLWHKGFFYKKNFGGSSLTVWIR